MTRQSFPAFLIALRECAEAGGRNAGYMRALDEAAEYAQHAPTDEWLHQRIADAVEHARAVASETAGIWDMSRACGLSDVGLFFSEDATGA